MGCAAFHQQVTSGALKLHGAKKYTSIAHLCLGESRVAKIKKQPQNIPRTGIQRLPNETQTVNSFTAFVFLIAVF